MSDTPNIGFPLLEQAQAQKEVTVNETLVILDALLGGVISQTTTAPPGSPSEGDAYIVPSGASGVWAGHVEDIAYFFGGVWNFLPPTVGEGHQVWVKDDEEFVQYGIGSPSGWESAGAALGYVSGPVTSTDNAVARFDGAGGITLQNSVVTIGDTGNVSGVLALSATTIELGHASDTTFSRVSAGVAAIEGQNILTAATGQPLDSDLTAIAALSPSNDDIVQRKAGAWTNRTIAQLATDITAANVFQPIDSDLTTIAGLTATTDNFIQAKSSAWASRTVAQVSADLQATGLVTDAVGFRTIPQNSQSAAYTTVASDSGKHLLHPSADANARTFTIDSNANVAYPVGTAITFVNETSQVLSIAITSDTLTLAGSTTTGTRSLAQNGVATAIKVTSTKWIISGTGLT